MPQTDSKATSPTEPARQTRESWFKATRHPDALWLIKQSRPAFILAYIIGHRARYDEDSFNPHGLAIGEALLGDYGVIGFTREEYRTAKRNLQKWGFATFRTTTRGTIAKLVDSRLFAFYPATNNHQNHTQTTNGSTAQQPSEQPLSRSEEQNSVRSVQPEKNDASSAGALPSSSVEILAGAIDEDEGMQCGGPMFAPTTLSEVSEFVAACNPPIPESTVKAWWHLNEENNWMMWDKVAKQQIPIFDWEATLRRFSEKYSPPRSDKTTNSEFWEWVREQGHDEDVVCEWIEYNTKKGWRRKNKRTGLLEPTVDYRKSLQGYLDKIATCAMREVA